MYVIQASPLSKIYLPEWEAKCIADPKVINSDIPFVVSIPRSTGSIVLEHNKPVHVANLIRYNGMRKVETDETKDVVFWLTDEMSHETMAWGVVKIDIDNQAHNLINHMLAAPDLMGGTPEDTESAVRKFADMQGKIIAHMRKAITEARSKADEKVKTQLKITHHNLIRQWENNQTAGGGAYPPSATEALGAWMLAEELKKASGAKQAMVQNLNELMKTTRVG